MIIARHEQQPAKVNTECGASTLLREVFPSVVAALDRVSAIDGWGIVRRIRSIVATAAGMTNDLMMSEVSFVGLSFWFLNGNYAYA